MVPIREKSAMTYINVMLSDLDWLKDGFSWIYLLGKGQCLFIRFMNVSWGVKDSMTQKIVCCFFVGGTSNYSDYIVAVFVEVVSSSFVCSS